MKTVAFLSFLFVLTGAFLATPPKPHPLAFAVPKGWPQPRYDFHSNPPTREGFELGKKIFYDENLSLDSTVACGTCHQPFAAFATFEHTLSHGVRNALSTRNAPALQNLAWRSSFMWDGSVVRLEDQPLTPITAPNEMGETIGDFLSKLRRNPAYPPMFRAAFGDDSVTTARTMRALAQFLVMLVSANSKYDKVMRGEARFILPEQTGYAIFRQKCASCHTEPLFTDDAFRNAGLAAASGLNDSGRMHVTKNPKDSLKFRVPSLRNVALTHPYGHDGRFFDLLNVFEHYRKNITIAPGVDSLLQHRIPLSNYEIGQLTAFLYTLTDSAFVTNPDFAPPGYALYAPPLDPYQHPNP